MSPDPLAKLRPPAPPVKDAPRTLPVLEGAEKALVAEACHKSDVLWIRPADQARAYAVWHVWHADAICLVHGEGEQQVPTPSGRVEVMVRSKDTGGRLLRFVAVADSPQPGSEVWRAAAGALALKRLNASEPAKLLDRWAATAVVTLLRPTGPVDIAAGGDEVPSEAAPAPRGPGTTLTRRPFHLGGRLRRAARRA